MKTTKTTFEWGDGKRYTFFLPMPQLEELQDLTGCGPEELFHRLIVESEQNGGIVESLRMGTVKPKAADLFEIHRLALIGGGVRPGVASALCTRYVNNRPRAESYASAFRILAALIIGEEVPDDLYEGETETVE